MRMNQKTRLVLAMAFSVASSALLAQEAAVFSNLVTCTTGRCREGFSATASFGRAADGGCTAYGTHSVTIGFNGEAQTVKAVCSGGSSCFAEAYVNIGGRDFGVNVYGQIGAYATGICERMAEGSHTE